MIIQVLDLLTTDFSDLILTCRFFIIIKQGSEGSGSGYALNYARG